MSIKENAEMNPYYLSSVGNALHIIDVLGENGSLAMPQICRMTGLGKSSAYRLLSTLVEEGFLLRESENKFRLSGKFVKYSRKVLLETNIVQIAQPYIKQIANETGLSGHLTVLDKNSGDAIFICKESALFGLQSAATVGTSMKAYRLATGKVLLAFLEDEDRLRLLSQYTYEKFTENTIDSAYKLQQELEKIKICGYAIDNEESEIGLRCVAVPIRSYRGKVLAALSLSGASGKVISMENKLKDLLFNTAEEMRLSL